MPKMVSMYEMYEGVRERKLCGFKCDKKIRFSKNSTKIRFSIKKNRLLIELNLN